MAHPELIDHLVIINVPHPQVMRTNLRGNIKQLIKSWYMLAFQLPVLPDWWLSRNAAKALEAVLTRTSRPGMFSQAKLEEYKRAWKEPGAVTGMLNWYRAAWRYPPKNRHPPELQCPVLIIWGEQDSALASEMAHESLQLCPHGVLIMMPGATHWVHHEEAECVSKLIDKAIVIS